MIEDRAAPAAHAWAAQWVRDWNDGLIDTIAGRLNRDVVVEAPSKKDGSSGGILASSRADYVNILPRLRAVIGPVELVSALGDEVSASLVLRDKEGTLFSVLLSFDEQGRILRIRSYARDSRVREVGRLKPNECLEG